MTLQVTAPIGTPPPLRASSAASSHGQPRPFMQCGQPLLVEPPNRLLILDRTKTRSFAFHVPTGAIASAKLSPRSGDRMPRRRSDSLLSTSTLPCAVNEYRRLDNSERHSMGKPASPSCSNTSRSSPNNSAFLFAYLSRTRSL